MDVDVRITNVCYGYHIRNRFLSAPSWHIGLCGTSGNMVDADIFKTINMTVIGAISEIDCCHLLVKLYKISSSR